MFVMKYKMLVLIKQIQNNAIYTSGQMLGYNKFYEPPFKLYLLSFWLCSCKECTAFAIVYIISHYMYSLVLKQNLEYTCFLAAAKASTCSFISWSCSNSSDDTSVRQRGVINVIFSKNFQTLCRVLLR